MGIKFVALALLDVFFFLCMCRISFLIPLSVIFFIYILFKSNIGILDLLLCTQLAVNFDSSWVFYRGN